MKDTWNYRVVRRKSEGESGEWLSIQEVYYDDETQEPMAHTMDLQVEGDTIAGMRTQLQRMLWCLDKEVVDEIESDVSNKTVEDRVLSLEMENAEMKDRLKELDDNMSERIRENLKNLKTGKKTTVTDEDVDQWKKDVLKRGGI